MSDVMKSIPFGKLAEWMLQEQKTSGTVFGVRKSRKAGAQSGTIFGQKLENPVGPAAGPNTQLAQNIAACYYAGARFFELKTVQQMDGAELAACIPKPCILAEDEAYNCEWSTELYMSQALEEYVKAWALVHVMAVEFGLGDPNGMVFNLSVGYDLEGIRSPKVDGFIESLKDASGTAVFQECISWLKEHLALFERLTLADVEAIPASVSNSMTLSTMHGCRPEEIERIASYLLTEKHLNTYVKCNPTLMGYPFVRKTMDELGYGYMTFDDSHFKEDLQYEDAVPMLIRLLALAKEQKLAFGVKLTNTFPVKAVHGELPSEEIYMSGKALFPLAISVAAKLSEDFDGKLPISFSGGADHKNIEALVSCGIRPVTVATALLKPGGCQWITRMAEKTSGCGWEQRTDVDVEALKKLAQDAVQGKAYAKGANASGGGKKLDGKPPVLDCLQEGKRSEKTAAKAKTEVKAAAEKKTETKPQVQDAAAQTEVPARRVCGNCVDVCPNRANLLIRVPGMEILQILHVDGMCNECGNCRSFCRYAGRPYKDKFTLFDSVQDMDDSANDGFAPVDKENGTYRVRCSGKTYDLTKNRCVEGIPKGVQDLIGAVIDDYSYLLK